MFQSRISERELSEGDWPGSRPTNPLRRWASEEISRRARRDDWRIGARIQNDSPNLRFYKDRGLLHPHRNGMARLYSDRDRQHLQMILKGRQLGFTLTEIQEILTVRDHLPEQANLKHFDQTRSPRKSDISNANAMISVRL